jgi:hypothetical protein
LLDWQAEAAEGRPTLAWTLRENANSIRSIFFKLDILRALFLIYQKKKKKSCKNILMRPGVVDPFYNPSYIEGGDEDDSGLRSAQAKS